VDIRVRLALRKAFNLVGDDVDAQGRKSVAPSPPSRVDATGTANIDESYRRQVDVVGREVIHKANFSRR